MKKEKILIRCISLLLSFSIPLALASCRTKDEIDDDTTAPCVNHRDKNADDFCDLCGEPIYHNDNDDSDNTDTSSQFYLLNQIFPGDTEFEVIELDQRFPQEINAAYQSASGVIFTVTTRGYSGDILTACGIGNDGKIVRIEIMKTLESLNTAFPYVTGADGAYNGKDSESLEVEIVSGATITSRSIYKAVEIALNGFELLFHENENDDENENNNENEFPIPSGSLSESEVLETAKNLIPGATGFTKQILDEKYKYIIDIYKENSGKGYIAYTSVVSPYNITSSETLIYIGNDCYVKSIHKIAFYFGGSEFGGFDLSEESIDFFYNEINGNTSSSIDSVELITGATWTSGKVVESVKEALLATEKLIASEAQTKPQFPW